MPLVKTSAVAKVSVVSSIQMEVHHAVWPVPASVRFHAQSHSARPTIIPTSLGVTWCRMLASMVSCWKPNTRVLVKVTQFMTLDTISLNENKCISNWNWQLAEAVLFPNKGYELSYKGLATPVRIIVRGIASPQKLNGDIIVLMSSKTEDLISKTHGVC